MHLFFTPDIQGDNYNLNEEESKHCVRVLRLVENDTVYLIDGKGRFYTTEITDAHPKRCVLKVVKQEQEYGKRNFYLHIAIAPTKNIERIEWFLEKVTEIGIDEITPIITKRSERKEVKTERLNKIIISAMKQSIKAYQPKLNEPVSMSTFCKTATADQKFIGHCEDNERHSFSEIAEKGKSILIMIGPEGDFTTDEINDAIKYGFKPITLGNSRLRTETAGIVACVQANLLNGI
jgi:16S rRNA (uracil1498-N3)-methyltransferase